MQPIVTKIAYSNYLINLQSNQLTFLDTRYYITQNGKFVPSVTTILEAYPKTAAFYEWLKKNGEDADEIRDEAGRRGSVVHSLTERYDLGEEVCLLNDSGFIDYKISEWSMFEKYVEFRKRFNPTVVHTELNLTSDALGFGGTIDRVIELDGRTILLDIKTSNAIHPHYWLQLAAYEKLLTEARGFNPIDAAGILWLNAKTKTDGKKGAYQGRGWQLIIKEDPDKDWELFKAAQTLWLAENGDSKPREVCYSLKHKHSI